MKFEIEFPLFQSEVLLSKFFDPFMEFLNCEIFLLYYFFHFRLLFFPNVHLLHLIHNFFVLLFIYLIDLIRLFIFFYPVLQLFYLYARFESFLLILFYYVHNFISELLNVILELPNVMTVLQTAIQSWWFFFQIWLDLLDESLFFIYSRSKIMILLFETIYLSF